MNNEPVAWIDKSKLDDWLHGDCYPDQCFIHYQANDAIPLYTHEYERPHNTVLVPCDKLAEMQAEIEALKEELDKQGKIIPFTESEIKYSKPQFPDKPVAWMLADKEAEHIRSIMAVQHDFVPEGCIEISL